MQRLPQLDPLVAFEAAVRLGSFVAAARALNVTASAVSQQIRGLETQLGVSLFQRGHRSVTPTDRGLEFYNSVSVALRHLSAAAADVRRAEHDVRIVIAADVSFATDWLMPRLGAFENEHPALMLHVKVTDDPEALLSAEVALAFVHGRGDWAGREAHKVLREEVFPVCAPEYAAQWSCGDWSTARLLDLDYAQWDWMNWSIWLTEMGQAVPEAGPALRMNSYPLLIDAARRGSGVALGWRGLVDADLAAGRLVRPVDGVLRTQNGYFLVEGDAGARPEVAVFRDWVMAQVEV